MHSYIIRSIYPAAMQALVSALQVMLSLPLLGALAFYAVTLSTVHTCPAICPQASGLSAQALPLLVHLVRLCASNNWGA
jgi:hypothetical protein